MSLFMYYQMDSESKWVPILEETKPAVIRKSNPMLFTILALDPLYEDGMTKEDSAKIKYKGPFYADFDCKEEDGGLEVVIDRFKVFLGKLEELDVNLNQVELYATGGRGFHALVPQKVFLSRPPPGGMVFLPHIYKEIAFSKEILVNTLDLAIYSGRRGRMLRAPNVKRANGRFKVAITADEAKAMTVERYLELTSAPRAPVPLDEPTLASGMAVVFARASDAVTKGAKARSSSKLDTKLVEQFKGEWPPSVVAMMNGETKEGVGFNVLAMQLACAANALGKSKADFLVASAGLIESHQSDGVRYNTPRKRKDELARLYDYTNDSVTYQFSAGGLKSCAKAGARCLDLADTTGDDPVVEGDVEEEMDVSPESLSVTQGVHVSKRGIYTTKEGIRVLNSNVGLANPQTLIDTASLRETGYEVDVYLDGAFYRRDTINTSDFQNKARFQSFISNQGQAGLTMDENKISGLQELLRFKAKGKPCVYTVGQEGVDVVRVRNLKGDYVEEQIYASKDGVISLGSDHKYKLHSLYNTESGHMDCDIHLAPMLTDTERVRDFFGRFFKLNSMNNVAKALGWYASNFISPMIRYKFNQYPILQIVGPAGAGKSKYTDLLMSLHYYKQKPKVFSASSITPFAMDCTLNASASIPIIFDELKASEISKQMHDKLRTSFRANYNGRASAKGRVDHTKLRDALGTPGLSNRAPLSFIGEALESQTAIVDRCVLIQLRESDRQNTADDFEWCLVNADVLSMLGRMCVDHAIRVNIDKVAETLLSHRKEVFSRITAKSNVDRPAFNYAVVILGLDFIESVLQDVFGAQYVAVFGTMFDRLRESLLDGLSDGGLPKNMSEGSKVLSTLAHLSRHGNDDTRMKIGEDYDYFKDPSGCDCIDVKLRVAYDKYKRHTRSLGEEPLYSSFDAMANGLRGHPCVVDRTCRDNPEFRGGGLGAQMYRFDLRRMADEESIEDWDAIPLEAVVLEFPKTK